MHLDNSGSKQKILKADTCNRSQSERGLPASHLVTSNAVVANACLPVLAGVWRRTHHWEASSTAVSSQFSMVEDMEHLCVCLLSFYRILKKAV